MGRPMKATCRLEQQGFAPGSFTLLAFFPEHQMRDFRSPSVEEMVHSYETVRSTGLTKVRLGNVGVFVHTEKDRKYLLARVDRSAY